MDLLAWCRLYQIINTLTSLDWKINWSSFFTSFAEKYSFGNILAQYELWVQNVSDKTPRIECKAQQMFMSDYLFETDKIANAPHTQGDGGHLEEVSYTLNICKFQ